MLGNTSKENATKFWEMDLAVTAAAKVINDWRVPIAAELAAICMRLCFAELFFDRVLTATPKNVLPNQSAPVLKNANRAAPIINISEKNS
jgi:hypothetical protein